MSDAATPSAEELRKEIELIVKDADLTTLSSKRVREQVEKKLNCSLLARKKEFDGLVMSVINDNQDSDEEESEEEEPSSDEAEVPKKSQGKRRPQPTQHKPAAKKKRKSLNASDSGSESDGGSDSDYEVPKKAPKAKKEGGKKAAKANGGAGTGRKGTGFTRAYNLSPDLAGLVGSESLARHEVVKKVWAIIKERNLYDPKNKQFTICDDELYKVMKVKRFRTFSMLKHLKPHFLD